ncbi:MAG: DNA-3-methyladenine glycosylase [Armatimonadetes bacterium]|nr:DNA-3-methyladenine glycosylase [Armatimonadota bacterium]
MSPQELRQFLTDSHVTDCAKRLLGCEIVVRGCRIRIVEAEAYGGPEDPNSHAYRGVTARNRVMFETTGCAYVYFNYGMHWLFNVTCRPQGEPGAILIRGAMPVDGVEAIRERRPKAKSDTDLLSGPGKIGAALAVTGDDTGTDLLHEGSKIRIVAGREVESVLAGPRVGLKDGIDHGLMWRFIDEANAEWASSPRP